MGLDETIHLWQVANGTAVRVLTGYASGDAGPAIAWSPDGKTLAVGDRTDRPIRLVDGASGKDVRHLLGHTNAISLLAWSPDGTMLASESDDETVRLWEVATGKEILRLDGHSLWSSPLALAWSPDGTMLALGGERCGAREDHTIHLWEVATGKEVLRLAGHEEWVDALAWPPDGKTLASGSADKTIRLWEAATGQEVRRFAADAANTGSLVWSPDGKTLASGGCRWEAATGGQIRRLDSLADGVLSPDGKVLASHTGRAIRLWEAATGKEISRFLGHGDAVGSVAWSPDGETLASGGNDATLRLWEVATAREVRRLAGHQSRVKALAWCPDGKMLAAAWGVDAFDDAIYLWEVTTGKEVGRLVGHAREVESMAWSPDGKTLASAAGSEDKVEWVAWSPDGETLASCGQKTIRLWDAATGEPVQRFTGHDGAVSSLAWSPDGKRMASGSSDTTLLIWAIDKHPDEPPIRLSDEQLTVLWSDLAGEDAGKAYRAIRKLVRGSGPTVPFLSRHLAPATAPDPKHVARLIADLDSEQFSAREKAARELEKSGGAVEGPLRNKLAAKPSLEVQRRIEQLLKRMEQLSPEPLRALRAVGVLERIGGAEAEQVLKKLAKGTEDARLTQEARASLDRLNRRVAAGK